MNELITRYAGGAVDKDKNHATEGPSDAEDADTVTGGAVMSWVGLRVVANDSGDGDVEEEESGNELGDESSVERPLGEFRGVEEWSRWWILVVFVWQSSLRFGLNVFSH